MGLSLRGLRMPRAPVRMGPGSYSGRGSRTPRVHGRRGYYPGARYQTITVEVEFHDRPLPAHSTLSSPAKFHTKLGAVRTGKLMKLFDGISWHMVHNIAQEVTLELGSHGIGADRLMVEVADRLSFNRMVDGGRFGLRASNHALIRGRIVVLEPAIGAPQTMVHTEDVSGKVSRQMLYTGPFIGAGGLPDVDAAEHVRKFGAQFKSGESIIEMQSPAAADDYIVAEAQYGSLGGPYGDEGKGFVMQAMGRTSYDLREEEATQRFNTEIAHIMKKAATKNRKRQAKKAFQTTVKSKSGKIAFKPMNIMSRSRSPSGFMAALNYISRSYVRKSAMDLGREIREMTGESSSKKDGSLKAHGSYDPSDVGGS